MSGDPLQYLPNPPGIVYKTTVLHRRDWCLQVNRIS